MAKQQGGLAYLIGLLVFLLVLVAPTQYSQDIKTLVRSAAEKVHLIDAAPEEAPAPQPPAPAPPPAKPATPPKPAPPVQPAPTPTKPTPAPAKPATPPKAKPTPTPAKPTPAPAKPATPAKAKPATPAKAKPAAQPTPTPSKPAAKPAAPAKPTPAPKATPATKPATATPAAKPAPAKAAPEAKKDDKKRQDGGGIGLPLAQQAPPAPAPAADAQPTEPAQAPAEEEAGPGAIERLISILPSAQFTLADALVWIIFVLWVIKVIVYKEIRQIRLFPLPVLVFMILAILSMIPQINRGAGSIDKPTALKELIQYIEYFIVGYLVIANNADTERSFKRVVRVLILATTLVIAVGMMQYLYNTDYTCVKNLIAKLGPLSGCMARLAEAPDAMSIRGTFGNRNVLGSFLAIMLPFLWGVALAHRRGLAIVTRVWMIILILAGLAITTSGGAMLAILGSMLAITFIRDEKFFTIVLVIVLVVGVVFGLVLKKQLARIESLVPRPNLTMLRDSTKLYKAKSAHPWQQRYMEWQASVNAIAANPVLGVGLGQYQNHINQYYLEMNKPAENYMERDAVNGLLVLGVTMGVPGLLAFLWILFKLQKCGAMGFSLLPPGLRKGAALGIYGSVISILIVSLFTNILVRGVGLVFVILLALGGQVNNLLPDTEESEKKEEESSSDKS